MLRGVWTWFVLVIATVWYGSLAVVAGFVRPGTDAPLRLMKAWARAILDAGRVRVIVEDENLPAAPGPALYLCNHRSNLDVWAIVAAVPDSTRFVAKQSLFRIPFLGWAMRFAGFVPVDRTDRRRAIQSLDVAAARVAQGKSLVMFPEGTRSRDGRLGPFKKGPFHVALAMRCPIVPVAIAGSFELLAPRAWWMRPGEIRVRLAPAIATAELPAGGIEPLARAVREAIAARLPEAARPAAQPAP